MPSMRWRELLGEAAQDIRAVLIDAVGTLIVPVRPVAVAYAEHGRRHGSRLDSAAIAERLPAAFRAADIAQGRSDERIERERWRAIVRHVFDDLDDTAALYEALWAHFSLPESWRLAAGAVELTGDALRSGQAVGVASNFDARLYQVLSGPNQLPSEVVCFISSELGWQKPHLGFFRAIQDRLGLAPRQMLLAGDDWTNDVVGALEAGWQVIWVSPNAPPVRDVAQVTTLADLLD